VRKSPQLADPAGSVAAPARRDPSLLPRSGLSVDSTLNGRLFHVHDASVCLQNGAVVPIVEQPMVAVQVDLAWWVIVIEVVLVAVLALITAGIGALVTRGAHRSLHAPTSGLVALVAYTWLWNGTALQNGAARSREGSSASR
jgi:hypothetical protein